MTSRQRSWLLPPAVLALIAGILLGRATPSPVLALIACLPVLAAVLLGKGMLRFISCLVLSLAIGAAAGSLAWHPSLPPEADYDVQGVITDEIRSGHFGQVRIKLSHVTLNGREHSVAPTGPSTFPGTRSFPPGWDRGNSSPSGPACIIPPVPSIRTDMTSGRNCSGTASISVCTAGKTWPFRIRPFSPFRALRLPFATGSR